MSASSYNYRIDAIIHPECNFLLLIILPNLGHVHARNAHL